MANTIDKDVWGGLFEQKNIPLPEEDELTRAIFDVNKLDDFYVWLRENRSSKIFIHISYRDWVRWKHPEKKVYDRKLALAFFKHPKPGPPVDIKTLEGILNCARGALFRIWQGAVKELGKERGLKKRISDKVNYDWPKSFPTFLTRKLAFSLFVETYNFLSDGFEAKYLTEGSDLYKVLHEKVGGITPKKK